MNLRYPSIAVALLIVGSTGPLCTDVSAQIVRLAPADTARGDYFGGSVAIDGGRLVIGASGRDACGTDSGTAYIYELEGDDQWRPAATLVPNDCADDAFFGRAVAISGDHAVVTSYRPFFSSFRSNAVYVFERDFDGVWRQTARLTAGESELEGPFAAAVSIDGPRIVVTSAGETTNGNANGAAYVFDRNAGGGWQRVARIAPDRGTRAGVFGTSVAVQGDRIAVSASTYTRGRPGSVYLFDRAADGSWSESAFLTGIDDFFLPIDLDADRLLVGESRGGDQQAGQATVIERRPDGSWGRTFRLTPSAPYPSGGFGSAIALDGDRALVVGFDEQLKFSFNIDRVVYEFERNPASNTWSQRHIIDVGALFFGTAVDLDQGHAVIGEASDSIPGAAYVVRVR